MTVLASLSASGALAGSGTVYSKQLCLPVEDDDVAGAADSVGKGLKDFPCDRFLGMSEEQAIMSEHYTMKDRGGAQQLLIVAAAA